jgi:hypothetical protein
VAALAALAVAGAPLIDRTRIVRMTENVRVVPSALWTTPLSSPLALTWPLCRLKCSGMYFPVTWRPFAVVPTTRDVIWPFELWATTPLDAVVLLPAVAVLPDTRAIDVTSTTPSPSAIERANLFFIGFPPS